MNIAAQSSVFIIVLYMVITHAIEFDARQQSKARENNPASFQTVRLCKESSKLKFPTKGFCINNRVYAKLGDDGELVRLEEGRYPKNAVGSPCTFTIKPNCGVTQND